MVKITEEALVGLSIILLFVASVKAFNSSFIWLINPPQTKRNYFNMTLTPNYYTQVDPSIPILQIQQELVEPGSFYAPAKVMYANVSVISNDIPSIPFNSSSQYELLGFKVGIYFGVYKVDNKSNPVLLQFQNETIFLNTTLTSYNKVFTWNSKQNNSLFYSGEQKINLFVASALLTQEQFRSHINQSIYYYSGLMETNNFLIYHHTPTRQIVIDSIGLPLSTQTPTFSYVNWGNFNYVVIVSFLVIVAILIPLTILRKKKMNTK